MLKIGSLDTPEHRWLDSVELFDEILIIQFESNGIFLQHNKIKYYTINNNKLTTWLNQALVVKLKNVNTGIYKFKILLFFLRIWNKKNLKKIFNSIQFNYCYSGYNDYDKSDILTILLREFIKIKIHRGYKETRPAKTYAEMYSLECADVLVFNHQINHVYFKEKYPVLDWNSKQVLLNLDDDWRSQEAIKSYKKGIKLSTENNKINVVILTGVARSDESNQRSGTRQFYIPLIKSLIACDYVVHLHALKYQNDLNNVNQYEILQKEYPNHFFIHKALDFTNNYKESYSTLSKYDFGILHNFRESSSVTKFDRINIPHRLYEYQIAEVIPIVKTGETTVVQALFEEKKCGLVYKDLSDLKNINHKGFEFYKPSHKQFLSSVFNL